ncbi:MAG: dephospho-CoA kinase [Bacteroidota bacterium]
MWKIGLTGSIGSGKSLVASLFDTMGFPVYHADEEAKRFYLYPLVTRIVSDEFGREILDEAGHIDKKKLAAIVFSDLSRLQWLNALIHPMVKEDFACWCNLHHAHSFVIHEAAILFESGFDKYFDRIILVTAPKVKRLERVVKRDQVDAAQILQRMDHQWDDEKKARLADYLINNEGNELLLPQVEAVCNTLKKLC